MGVERDKIEQLRRVLEDRCQTKRIIGYMANPSAD